MNFDKKHIYKKDHVLPNWSKERLLTYIVMSFVLLFTLIVGMEDSGMYRTNVMSAQQARDLLIIASKEIGDPYKLGATGMNAWDCSSITQYSFNKALNIALPRISYEQAKVGITVTLEKIRAGDLLFMDTLGKNRISHVGIYMGKDKNNGNKPIMLHANSYSGKVVKETLSGKYWRDVLDQSIVKRINTLTKDNKNSITKTISVKETVPPLPQSEPTKKQLEEIKKTGKISYEFNDVPDDYPFKEAITSLASKNIISGTGDGNFSPYRYLTRAELLKVAFKTFNIALLPGGSINLTDVNNHWVESYLKTAVKKGYVKGYADNTFKPDKTVSRAEGAKIIIEIARIADKYNSNVNFDDISNGDWKQKYASIIKTKNLLPLDGNIFKPDQGLTRGEAVKIIYSIDEL